MSQQPGPSSAPFDRVLVANRGEIACRIIRSVRAMGLSAVAVYSEADADAPHVELADQAVCVGASPAAASYLNVEALLGAAALTGAGAIHPGYGFLSENAAFARACEEAGRVFVGPPAAAIASMGNKAEAKRRMRAAGVPCVPGREGAGQSDAALEEAAASIGYPVMIKAAAGGGGRGMRRVDDAASLPGALALARAEAASAFGSDELILERAIDGARHVEIQVMVDGRGEAVHLGERDCSIQRRHQKIIEEAPCPVVTPDLRAAMGRAALAAAAAIGYRGAGTVEFLLDDTGRFWFLEMNTRLQVEHPVTEMVTGLDLVELQLRIAAGEPLGLSQDDVRIDGHAIEARLYTEDPDNGFLPTTGRVVCWLPPSGPGVRTDAGIRAGNEVGPYYDPLVAKIIAHGPTREMARRRLVRALGEAVLFGPGSNKAFLVACLEDSRFTAGRATTAFCDAPPATATSDLARDTEDAVAAAAVWLWHDRAKALQTAPAIDPDLLDWSSGIGLPARYRIGHGDGAEDVTLRPAPGGRATARIRGHEYAVRTVSGDAGPVEITVGDRRRRVVSDVGENDVLWLSLDGREHRLQRPRPGGAESDSPSDGGRVEAPMHGVIQSIAVVPGDRVEVGQPLLVMEAMKMQQEVGAPVAGRVNTLDVRTGQQVGTGETLLTIDAE
jgi:geranyl-CoA carboxylase alpha subunit